MVPRIFAVHNSQLAIVRLSLYGLVATEFLAAAAFPGPVFGVILGLPLLGLGVAKGVAIATARA